MNVSQAISPSTSNRVTSEKTFIDHLLNDFCSPEDFQLLRNVMAIYHEIEAEKEAARVDATEA